MPLDRRHHFLSTQDWTDDALESVLERASALKHDRFGSTLLGKTLLLLFFNPSLRTRTSFDVGVRELGGTAVTLNPGRDSWPLEWRPGAVMDGEAEEHVSEAARVLSRYGDVIGVRSFPAFKDWAAEREDPLLEAFARHSEVPVVNLETIVHPCQELAHALTLREKLGDLRKRKYLLTWTYHPRPLNTAVANSSLLIATRLGMHVTLLCPTPDYILDPRYTDAARANAEASGGSLSVTHDVREAYDGAHVVYAKSWGALPYFGRWEEEKPVRDRFRDFIVDDAKMSLTDGALFSHCLPVRRNVKVTDSVLDSPACVAVDEAENRLHVQKAVLERLVGRPAGRA